jgi:hypothetical protein
LGSSPLHPATISGASAQGRAWSLRTTGLRGLKSAADAVSRARPFGGSVLP